MQGEGVESCGLGGAYRQEPDPVLAGELRAGGGGDRRDGHVESGFEIDSSQGGRWPRPKRPNQHSINPRWLPGYYSSFPSATFILRGLAKVRLRWRPVPADGD